jgi:hypothetical protein
MRWIIAILFCLLAACRHPAYTLARQGRSQILTPPPSKPEIKNARQHPAQKTGCDIESETFSLEWRGNTARLTVKPEAYYAPPVEPVPQPSAGGITIRETGPRIYSDSLAQLENFRQAVAAREDAGCLRDNEGARLWQAITEAFPFPPQIAAYLRFGAYTQTGSIDLIPGFVLRLVSPNGSEPDVSFYAVSAVPGEDRVRISGTGKSLAIPGTPGYSAISTGPARRRTTSAPRSSARPTARRCAMRRASSSPIRTRIARSRQPVSFASRLPRMWE